MAKIVLITIGVFLLGLAVRVDPDLIIFSVVAWLSFIFGSVLLIEKEFKIGRAVMVAALTYNAFFHWYLLYLR